MSSIKSMVLEDPRTLWSWVTFTGNATESRRDTEWFWNMTIWYRLSVQQDRGHYFNDYLWKLTWAENLKLTFHTPGLGSQIQIQFLWSCNSEWYVLEPAMKEWSQLVGQCYVWYCLVRYIENLGKCNFWYGDIPFFVPPFVLGLQVNFCKFNESLQRTSLR